MQYADVNGIRIAYGIRGSGPPLVLIMGYRLSSLAWPLDFIEALAERFTVVLFDNRGTGTSEKPTSGYEISNMARDVGGLLDHLEIGRANVLGYSMGGRSRRNSFASFPIGSWRWRSVRRCAAVRAPYMHLHPLSA
jgi:pimeloyl-ACP methyl ester carboxylesterase